MKIVLLDGQTTNPGDLDWAPLKSLGDVEIYDQTPPKMRFDRAKNADILIVNKVVLDEKLLSRLPQLKCICVLATGYNNINVSYAAKKGIPVCNVAGYSTHSVAQHVFALLFGLMIQPERHSANIKNGGWTAAGVWSYSLTPVFELRGKTMGIYGFGRIGKRVGEIARGFGMEVIALHKHPERDAVPGVRMVEKATFFRESDVISLHAPLTSDNIHFINKKTLSMCKPSAFLINTGRGGLICEPDLREALESGIIAGAGLDVLSEEPPAADHPLLSAPNCLLTPHMAWRSIESRQRLLEKTVQNIRCFLAGKPQNVVNGVR
ncbi:MAG: D-2-hydroxyacid dehydrogenase [Bacteroidetes bacterium]|nr:MAG: D-2-hydroxyacid dehydrogenase [Bacteroidota bacterium]